MRAESTGNRKTYRERGSSLLEILIAVWVLTLGISAATLLSFSNQSLKLDVSTNNEALAKAQALLENERADSRLDFALVNPILPFNEDIYTKKVDVEVLPDFFTKKVTSFVGWPSEGGRVQNVNLTTLVTNLEGPGGGTTCNSVLSGDWSNPQITSYEFGKDLLIPSDPSSGFPIGDIDVNNHKLYVVVNNSHGNNDPNFFKFDISSPIVPPVFESSVDNAPVKAGLNAVHVGGNYAYMANAYGANYLTCPQSVTCSQLQIIDLTTMTVVGKLKIPGVVGNGGQAIGTSIFYKEGIVYLGLAKTDSGPEFNIIDVGGGGAGGSPTNPVYLGGFPVGNGVNAIHVKDQYAYLASPNDEELKILDVSVPPSPSQVGQFDAPLGGGNNGNGKSLALVGTTLYLGRTLLNGNEFYILDDTIPAASLSYLGFRNIQNTSGNNTSVNGIIVRDYLAFLLTNDDFQTLRIDDSTNPYTITPYAVPLPTPGGSGTTIDCEGNYIYFASLPSNDKGYIAIVGPGP